MKSERIVHWTKMRRSRARFSELESSVYARSLADFITNMFGFRFSVHTGVEEYLASKAMLLRGEFYRIDSCFGVGIQNAANRHNSN